MSISKVRQWLVSGLITEQEATKLLKGADKEWQKQKQSKKVSTKSS